MEKEILLSEILDEILDLAIEQNAIQSEINALCVKAETINEGVKVERDSLMDCIISYKQY